MRQVILEDKIFEVQDLEVRISKVARPLVMTNGVFDILHRGHVDYLHHAAEHGATLLVAVNTDKSARMLGKGPGRPINSGVDRAYVLAGLASVDLITLFDERTPIELVKAVRPDIYVKGGDYDMEALEETQVVRSWGGQSFSIPFVSGFSTTTLVDRMRQPQAPLRRAAFLDRDGVINKDNQYVYRWEDFEFIPGAIEGMLKLQSAGYLLVIVTNQSGLARGYYSEDQYEDLSKSLREHLAQRGVEIAGIFHCPHHPEGSVRSLALVCNCRKPKPGLLLTAAHELGLDMPNSILIGDKQTDIDAAKAAGVSKAYMLGVDNPQVLGTGLSADGYYANLIDCADDILKNILIASVR
jgi:rfaE bifunctional protein nucleotidyltransferase chain/domain